MNKFSNGLKIGLGIVISTVFLYLAFRKLDFKQMKDAFSKADYGLIIPSLMIIFTSHWLRSIRWHFLLNPIKNVKVSNLFSALLIGYAANTILPAHLGELLRAYVIGRKRVISVSSVLATIVVERIIDVLSIVMIMAFSLVIYPVPAWVKKSGYLMFIFIIGLFFFLIVMKKYTELTMRCLRALLKPFPLKLYQKIDNISRSFLDGLKPMHHSRDYVFIFILSLLIWFCYWGVIYINFYTFNLVQNFNLDVISGLVLLVITTISVVVPSSPGYIGTYHWLCQLSLELFKIPRAIGLTYAIVLHAISFFPVFVTGLIMAWKEGVKLSKVQREKKIIGATEAG